MADRASAKSRAQSRKKKNAMKGVTVKSGGKLPVKQGAGITQKGRDKINRETGSNHKAPQPEGCPRKKSFCARSRGWTGERGKAARRRWKC